MRRSPGSGAWDQGRAHRRELYVLGGREAADSDCPCYLAVAPDGNASAPAGEPGVAEPGHLEALLGVAGFVSDLLCRFALACRGPGFVFGDFDRRDWRPVHPGKGDHFAVGVGHDDHRGPACRGALFNDGVDDGAGFLIVDTLYVNHGGIMIRLSFATLVCAAVGVLSAATADDADIRAADAR